MTSGQPSQRSGFRTCAFFAAILTAFTGLVGCGDESSSLVEPTPTQNRFAGHDPKVRDALLGLFAGESTRQAAGEELVQRCMAARGFRYVKNPAGKTDVNPTFTPDPYGIGLAEAKRYGYRAEADLRDAPKDQDRSGIMKLSESERARWSDAFWGRDSAGQVRVNLPGGGVVETNREGCLAEAKRTLFGSLERWLELSNFAGGLAMRGRRQANADPAMTKLNTQWSQCMARRGYAGLASPDAARHRAATFHSQLGPGSRQARDKEIKLAVADTECELENQYAPQRRKIEDRHYANILRANKAKVTAVLEMNKEALAKAERILSRR